MMGLGFGLAVIDIVEDLYKLHFMPIRRPTVLSFNSFASLSSVHLTFRRL